MQVAVNGGRKLPDCAEQSPKEDISDAINPDILAAMLHAPARLPFGKPAAWPIIRQLFRRTCVPRSVRSRRAAGAAAEVVSQQGMGRWVVGSLRPSGHAIVGKTHPNTACYWS